MYRYRSFISPDLSVRAWHVTRKAKSVTWSRHVCQLHPVLCRTRNCTVGSRALLTHCSLFPTTVYRFLHFYNVDIDVDFWVWSVSKQCILLKTIDYAKECTEYSFHPIKVLESFINTSVLYNYWILSNS